jgi:hypothetical protein
MELILKGIVDTSLLVYTIFKRKGYDSFFNIIV